MQHAYWFGRRHARAMNAPSHYYFEFDGSNVDSARLASAVESLFARHPLLRARFLDDGRQQILPVDTSRGLKIRDLRELGEQQAAAILRQVRDEESNRCLDAEQGHCWDIQLSLISDTFCRLHINIDMLIADATSFRILIAELAVLYAQPDLALPQLSYGFRHYIEDRSKQTELDSDRQYWTSRLATLPGPPSMPVASGGDTSARFRPTRRELSISRVEWMRLAERTRGYGVTLAMTFLTAYAAVIANWSSSPHFLVNVPLFDRQPLHPDVSGLVGDFTGTILLEVDFTQNRSFIENARRLQEQFRADVVHSGRSGVSVLRDLSRLNLQVDNISTVVFTSSLGMGELFTDLVRSSFGRLSWMIYQTPQVILDNQVVEHAGGLLVNWDAAEGVFAEGVLDAMFGAYRELLHWLGSSESDWGGRLPELLPRDQGAVRAAVNMTRGEESGRLLHEDFFAWAEREPDAAAVMWGEAGCWSYGETAHRALQLAALLRQKGVRSGDTVGVSLAKGPAQVVAVLGVLAAGGVYVPVGLEQPPARRQRIFDSAGIRTIVDADTMAAACDFVPLARAAAVHGEALAYVIYTSGSTGEPKGVEITHRAAMNTVEAINDRYGVGRADRALLVSALDFDLSVYDIFGLLSAGGAVVALDEEARRDARCWAEQIRRWGVTIWNSVPVLLDMLLTAAHHNDLASLRVALLGGDWVEARLVSHLMSQAPGCRFAALGGTTETTIHSTVYEVSQIEALPRMLPYGVPLRNVVCRVVDERGGACPDWVAGELWIGGAGVAAGYRGNAAASAQRFVNWNGERWYRTGDLARYWPDGTLEFLGRADFQVKIRGHRIELAEIETALASHPDVRGAVAVAFGDSEQRVGAAVVASSITVEDIHAHVTRLLPDYMVPARIIVLDRLPLSANGKVDRPQISALLQSAAAPAPAPHEAPRGDMERHLAQLWSQLLGKPDISRHDNFFALGGDSLLATRLGQMARRQFGFDVPLKFVFSSPALIDLAASIERELHDTEAGVVE
jgi:amino acid adenylation domain-containing protein